MYKQLYEKKYKECLLITAFGGMAAGCWWTGINLPGHQQSCCLRRYNQKFAGQAGE